MEFKKILSNSTLTVLLMGHIGIEKRNISSSTNVKK